MAKLLEHQGKGWLREAGLPVPRGRAASTPEEAAAIAAELGCPVVVKAQVHAGGRGKSGGLVMADTPEQAALGAASLLGREFKGAVLREVLVEEKLDIAREFYASYTVNSSRDARCPMLMFSAEGGVDIESVPEEKLFRLLVSPTKGPGCSERSSTLLREAGISRCSSRRAGRLSGAISSMPITTYDCFTLEINPLVLTAAGRHSTPPTARWRSTTTPSSGTRRWASRWPAILVTSPPSWTSSAGASRSPTSAVRDSS